MTIFQKHYKPEVLSKAQDDDRKNIFNSWFSNWNKVIAGTTALVIFLALVALVIFNIQTEDLSSRDSKENSRYLTKETISQQHVGVQLIRWGNNDGCTLGPSCNIICSGQTNVSVIQAGINAVLNNSEAQCYDIQINELTLESVTVKLTKGWLKDVTRVHFKTLNILNSQLEIEDEALADEAIKFLQHVILGNLQTTLVLRKETFQGANSISSLEMSGVLLQANENVFNEIASTLELFQCQSCGLSSEVLENITGPSVKSLANLQMLDLRDNNLGKISNYTFASANLVSTFYLSRSGITEVETMSFASDSTILILDLSDNRLETLPKGVFKHIGQNAINIKGNGFNCDCSFVWFKDFFLNNPGLFCPSLFYCSTESGNVRYDKVEFCPDNKTSSSDTTSRTSSTTSMPTTSKSTTTPITSTSTTSSPTTPTTSKLTTTTMATSPSTTITPSTTTQPPPDSFVITCEDYPLADDLGNVSKELEIEIRNGNITLAFSQIDETDNYSLRIIPPPNTTQNLLWIDSKKTVNCIKDASLLSNKIKIKLEYEETYTFCVKDDNATTVSPFDCSSLTVPPEWALKTWIPNKSKNITISIICGSLLFAILISAIIMFCCIRRYPKLIKGNKRVIIVESKTSTPADLSRNYDQMSYIYPPSLNSYSDGYLTPKSRFYENIYNGGGSSVVRTISRNSFVSNASPVQSPTVSARRYRKSNMRRRVKLRHISEAFDDHVYEPPPLPPNHPSEWQRHSDFYSYSRV